MEAFRKRDRPPPPPPPPPLIHVSLFKDRRWIFPDWRLAVSDRRVEVRFSQEENAARKDRRRRENTGASVANVTLCLFVPREPISKADTRYCDQCHWPIWNTIRGNETVALYVWESRRFDALRDRLPEIRGRAVSRHFSFKKQIASVQSNYTRSTRLRSETSSLCLRCLCSVELYSGLRSSWI